MRDDTGIPTNPNNQPPWPPHTNRETRRKCAKRHHGWMIKTIDGITACAECGAVLP